jgi:exonuclease III
LRIATWNVNSIRAREERLLRWLERNQPDVMCLQERSSWPDPRPGAGLTGPLRSDIHYLLDRD